jgi:hypothetical protein
VFSSRAAAVRVPVRIHFDDKHENDTEFAQGEVPSSWIRRSAVYLKGANVDYLGRLPRGGFSPSQPERDRRLRLREVFQRARRSDRSCGSRKDPARVRGLSVWRDRLTANDRSSSKYTTSDGTTTRRGRTCRLQRVDPLFHGTARGARGDGTRRAPFPELPGRVARGAARRAHLRGVSGRQVSSADAGCSFPERSEKEHRRGLRPRSLWSPRFGDDRTRSPEKREVSRSQPGSVRYSARAFPEGSSRSGPAAIAPGASIACRQRRHANRRISLPTSSF